MKILHIGTDPDLAQPTIEFVQELGIDIAGKQIHTYVLHDGYCPMLRGGPRCKCDPEFRIARVTE